MNQMEFDQRIAALKDELRQAKRALGAQRCEAQSRLAAARADAQARKAAALMEYRDAICDLATRHSPRGAAFMAGQARAANERDARCAETDALLRDAEQDFCGRSRSLAEALDAAVAEHGRRKEALMREYRAWVESRQSNRAAVREMLDMMAQAAREEDTV